jgi:Disulfide bond formation protein DsbB
MPDVQPYELATVSSVRAAGLFFAMLTVIAQAAVLVAVVLWIGARFSSRVARGRDAAVATLGPDALWVAWVVALTCTLGSLYYSEVAHFVPCKLCWYQRICMYPLSVFLLVAAVRRSALIARAALPLVAIGGAISAYHYLIERVPSLAGSASCDPTAPCTIVWVWRFHYISIPLMALSGFALIAVAVLVARPIVEEAGRRALSEEA